jgi:type VI protein secretion system component VasK
MTIEFQLKEKEYIVLMLKRAYPKVLLLSAMLLCLLGWVIFPGFKTESLKYLSHPAALTFFVLLLLVYPLFILVIKFKRNFRSNKMLKEQLKITFEKDFMEFQGESFTSRVQSSRLYKIAELKDYFLFYQSKNVFNIIPKRAIGNNIAEFKRIIKT